MAVAFSIPIMTVSIHFPLLQAATAVTHAAAYADGPRLLADVGGTNARFALESAPGQIGFIAVLPCTGYPTLAAALQA